MDATQTLFESGGHRNLLLPDQSSGLAVQANQHLIVDGDEACLLDPGGHKVYSKVLAETLEQLGRASLTHIFFSHQDPDIIAAANGWLMTTDARAYISSLWVRFVPHFGLDQLLEDRLEPIPDEGRYLKVGQTELVVLPAHFLHSCGNFQIYDPTAKILYSGDLGASLGQSYEVVEDFDAHLTYMEGFHRRYMTSKKALSGWADMAAGLDIEVIAPQHGARFEGPAVARFIDWCRELECGVDLLPPPSLPPRG